MRAATAPSSSDLSAHLLRAAIAILVLTLLPAAATAQVRDEEAHGLYMAGAAAYEAGNFEDALGYFQRSYELSPHPELLFNIAQAADRARLDEVALDALRRYLDSPVTIENREQLEARVRALEAAVARGEAAAPSDDGGDAAEENDADPSTVPSAGPSAGPDVAGVALTVSGGVLVLVSPILLGLGAVDTAALADPHDGETYAQALARQDVGTGLVAGGFVTLGVGLVVLAVGTAILASGSGSGSADGGRARLTPNGLAISF